ncbi:ATP-dependent DNA ligase LigD ligase module /ATP-dependent DNA ligase LigD phosphoesterase module /ATP-dependent DNA ligase LigD polymerase module [Dietzia kunjamensis]|uniref:ATP-dependent DNA ligase n=1 Tax=Dietzia kunjamensis TaxID=322509 RepID=UPI000E73BED2|nr:ATP-dependent DNA ligase [Dietzia kunjamensis]MBB1012348.1 ATP-dependent DNA ligase [Dietzia kunjamensis]RKE59523.1 ATP-dependent DNA ligase LigD ligase module /ATP-dependent DNA ligase LigD phosphoesterase module /ATP-dependent DNA ligase LigD polymerase module [Dietzia kunjamensis]
MASKSKKEAVEVDGRTIRFTHADKVLYEATGTTKADVLEYYLAVAPLLLTYAGRRPVTRKRWPDGTDDKSFFEKNLPSHAPDWVQRVAIEHSSRTVRYPVLDSPATLAWFAQQAALELHVPQWTLENDEPGRTRRIVIDLDPGEDVDLDTTAKVALRVRDLLSEAGLDSFPVTSGSKGIHLYARLDKAVTAASASKVAKQIAQSLAKQTPDLVTATMKRSIREGKVFVDWSQNSGAKTTVAPYSLRGRAEPWVAAPRSWEELGDGGLAHLHWDEVLKRLDSDGDLLDGLEGTAQKKATKKKSTSSTGSASRAKKSGGSKKSSSSSDDEDPEPADTDSTDGSVATHSTEVEGCDAEPTSEDAVVTSLAEYRRKRDRRKTPEPFDGEVETDRDDVDGPIFVIQEHHARRLHFDLRLEHHGVLASWAVPKNLPTEPKDRRLAVNTEDHPLGYETFEGTIPKGEYGAGHMTIWDRGWYECEKWREDEIIVWLHGDKVSGRYVLVRTSAEKNQWIVQYMKDQSPDSFYGGRDNPKSSYPEGDKRARSGSGSGGSSSGGSGGRSSRNSDSANRPDAPPLPMIPTAATVTELPDDKWAFEGKWDGYRVTIATSGAGGQARLVSRNGNSMDWLTDGFPGLADALERPAVIDAELVILGPDGVPDFASLAKQAAAEGQDSSLPDVELFVFDVLEVDGVDLRTQAWERRREVLDLLTPALTGVDRVHVPAVLDGPGDRALAEAKEFGWEGIVAKRRDSRYESGRRSKAWLKEKLLTTTEAVVGGWRPGKGGRSGSLGSLLLGLPAETGLTYIGRVGTGFSDKQARALLEELEPLTRKTSPFVEQLPADARRDAIWVLPKLVVEVRHQGFTEDGHMRQSSWRDIRRDKLPGDL